MEEEMTAAELIARSAAQNDVPVDVVKALLDLENEFPDFTVFGAKPAFGRRVAQILDEAANQLGAINP